MDWSLVTNVTVIAAFIASVAALTSAIITASTARAVARIQTQAQREIEQIKLEGQRALAFDQLRRAGRESRVKPIATLANERLALYSDYLRSAKHDRFIDNFFAARRIETSQPLRNLSFLAIDDPAFQKARRAFMDADSRCFHLCARVGHSQWRRVWAPFVPWLTTNKQPAVSGLEAALIPLANAAVALDTAASAYVNREDGTPHGALGLPRS